MWKWNLDHEIVTEVMSAGLDWHDVLSFRVPMQSVFDSTLLFGWGLLFWYRGWNTAVVTLRLLGSCWKCWSWMQFVRICGQGPPPLIYSGWLLWHLWWWDHIDPSALSLDSYDDDSVYMQSLLQVGECPNVVQWSFLLCKLNDGW